MYYRYENIEKLEEIETPYEFFKNIDVLLIRHGESESNALRKKLELEGKLLENDQKIEDAKIDLSSEGKKQAEELGKKLRKLIDEENINKENILVLVSPYERARKTFEIANKYMEFDEKLDNIFVLNSLREQFYGAFHMISKEVKKKEFGKLYEECQKNEISFYKPQLLGESPAQVADRAYNVLNFIKEYSQKNRVEKVLIFAHKDINRCLAMDILNLPAEFYDSFKNIENTSIINVKNGKYNNMQ